MIKQEPKSIGRPSLLTTKKGCLWYYRLLKLIIRNILQHIKLLQIIFKINSTRIYVLIQLDILYQELKNLKLQQISLWIMKEHFTKLVEPEKIDQYFDQLEEILEFDIPPEFIISIDESVFQEWVDARRLQCIVPADSNKSSKF